MGSEKAIEKAALAGGIKFNLGSFVSPLFLVAVIGLAVVMRLSPLFTRPLLSQDEIISYMLVTGNRAEYLDQKRSNSLPVKSWMPAHEWQRYMQVENSESLDALITDLGSYDIHPPLYFVLLYGWTSLFGFGTGYANGMIFSGILDLACFGLIVFWGRELLARKSLGWLAGLVWLLSPTAIRGGAYARPYSLLTLLALLFGLLLYYFLTTGKPVWRKWLVAFALLVTAVAGMLTHMLFLIIVCAGFVAAVFLQDDRKPRWLLILPFAIAIALFGIALWLPGSESWRVYLYSQASALGFTSNGLSRFAVRSFPLLMPLYVPLFLYVGAVALANYRHQPLNNVVNGSIQFSLSLLLIMTAVSYLLYALFYLSGLFAWYAVKARHLLFLTPYIALLATALLQLLPSPLPRRLIVNGLLVGLLLASLGVAGRDIYEQRNLSEKRIADYEYIVVDDAKLSGLFTYMQPDSMIYVADQDELLAMPERWLPSLLGEGGIYVSRYVDLPLYPNNGAGRDKILALIEESGNTRLIGAGMDRGANVSIYEASN